MKIKKTVHPKFNFDTMSDRDKGLVKEVINFLKEDKSNFDEKKEKSILQKFQISDIPKFDLSNSNFLRHARKLKIFYNDQGVIRVGDYPDVKEYPIVSIQADIRDLEKLYASIASEINNLRINSEESK